MNKNLERFYSAIESKSNFLLFDLEANFYELNNNREYETIQFGYIKFDSNLNVLNKGSIFIKPTKYPILSDFIKELTGIKQGQIDNGISFSDGLKQFYSLFNPDRDYIMSYGYYDMKQIFSDCKINNIDYPFEEGHQWEYSKHINIKNALAKKLDIREKGMGGLMDKLGLELEGKHHNGEDDCFNILKLIKKVFN